MLVVGRGCGLESLEERGRPSRGRICQHRRQFAVLAQGGLVAEERQYRLGEPDRPAICGPDASGAARWRRELVGAQRVEAAPVQLHYWGRDVGSVAVRSLQDLDDMRGRRERRVALEVDDELEMSAGLEHRGQRATRPRGDAFGGENGGETQTVRRLDDPCVVGCDQHLCVADLACRRMGNCCDPFQQGASGDRWRGLPGRRVEPKRAGMTMRSVTSDEADAQAVVQVDDAHWPLAVHGEDGADPGRESCQSALR